MGTTPGGAPLTIVDGLRGFAAAQPHTAAVIDGDRTLGYRHLDERANRVANTLLAAGLDRGERVAVLLGNRLEYCEIAAGIAKAGMVMVPLNPRLTSAEVRYIVRHSGSRALIADDAGAPIAGESAAGLPFVLSIDGTTLGGAYEDALAGAESSDPDLPLVESDAFCIAYTSGTTGNPKGVVISHRSRALTFYMSALEWNLGIGRRSLAVAPMYHGAGFAFGYAPVHTGGTVSMLRSWSPEKCLALLERDRIQSVFLVPTHAYMLRALGDEAIASYDLSALDTIFFNAAALPGPLKAWVLDAFPQAGVHELYGSTESGIIANLRPADARRKTGSVGHPWFQTEVRVLGADGTPAAPGEPGELFSRSPYLMNGYLDNAAATEECTTGDGFVTCGDIVVRDEEGYLYIVDRKKDVIISGGVNVYPREVEEAVLSHPAVDDVAVVGIPHEKWGEQVAAAVVLAAGADLTYEELAAHVRPLLAGYKVPRELAVVPELPRNAGGKVLKRELRDRLGKPG
ncbi:class I adenylate-forming enzyme family protein [Yinghuangia seranimata]|uniref:class I adenylate-forming enzyme family protein n=1 Tax=Yinghuangia seranimata TaxID=408067 RepID=UPI00248D221C|nr:AMP-binding protein [Yinghuangia seranimata]MDI2132432.1 AMP-binding protein [Yinghuangia seranimata]